MKLLYSYLKQYRSLVLLTLVLATINQVFSLLDPYVFSLIIDNYVSKFSELTSAQFRNGVGLLLAAAVGVAFVSRVAKNFQDYFTNVITQRMGADIPSNSRTPSSKTSAAARPLASCKRPAPTAKNTSTSQSTSCSFHWSALSSF